MSIAPAATQLTSYERIIDALAEQGFHPQKRGFQTMALCPVHADSHRSLSITYQPVNERTMVNCFTESCRAGYVEVLERLGLDPKLAFDKPLERGSRSARPTVKSEPRRPLPPRIATRPEKPADVAKNAWREVTRYQYSDDLGTIVLEVIRYEATVNGKRLKRFSQRYLNPATNRWVSRKADAIGFAPVLYNQPEVKTALANDDPVWIVEGEKDADTAIANDLVATTNAEGAGGFPDELLDIFAGGRAHIVLDNDPSGAKSAADLYDKLTALTPAAEVRLFLPKLDEAKADLTDHIAAGHDIEDLVEISVDDARALVALGGVRSALSRVQAAYAEASAYLERDDTDSGSLWVKELEKQLQWVEAEVGRFKGSPATPIAQKASREARKSLELAYEARDATRALIGHAPAPTAPTLDEDAPDEPFDGGDIDGPTEFDGVSSEDEGAPNQEPRIMVRRGQTVQRIETDGKPRYKTIFDGWAHVVEERTIDDGSKSEVTRPRDSWLIKWYRWRRDENGRPLLWPNGNHQVDEATVVFDHDMVRNRSWVNALPWSGMLLDTSTRGIALAWTAIFQARRVAPDAAKTIYTTPGWRTSAFGPFFVHAGGAIGSSGTLPNTIARFDANGPFSMYELPDPSDVDGADLREAWVEGTQSLVNELPARVIAPLLACVWHSPLGKNELVTHLTGARAAAKTGTAGLAVQFFAPHIYYRAKRQAMMSLTDSGSSLAGLFIAGGQFGAVPAILDDAAPDGAIERVRKKLGDFTRQYHNRVPKTLGSRDGGFREYRQLEFTPITTGELSPDASNMSRMLIIPLNPRDIPNVSTRYPKLETHERRWHRAMLGAALVQYIAKHWDELQAEQDMSSSTLQTLISEWQERLSFLGDGGDGIKSRYAGDAVRRHFGVRLMLRMLIEREALTEDEASDFEEWAIAGLVDAYRLQETAGSDPALQMLERLRDALAQGITHITNRFGGPPTEDLEQSGYTSAVLPALGYRERSFGGGEPVAEPLSRGERCGVVVGDELWLIPSRTFEVASKVAAAGSEAFNESIQSIGSSLISHGLVRVGHNGRPISKQRIGGAPTNVWVLPLSVLFQDHDEGDDEQDISIPDPIEPDPTPALDIPEPDELVVDIDEQPAVDVQRPTEAPAVTPAAKAPSVEPAAARPIADAIAFGDHGELLDIPNHRAPRHPLGRPAEGHQFRAAVAVLHDDGLWLPDGTLYQLPEIQHFGSLVNAALLLDLGGRRGGWKIDVPTIYITLPAATKLGIPLDGLPAAVSQRSEALAERTENHPMLTAAIADGWSISKDEKPHMKGFTRIHAPESGRAGSRYIGARIALLPLIAPAIGRAFEDDPSPVQLALRLQKIADYGMPFTVSPGVTGRNLMADTVFPSPEHKDWREEFMSPSHPVNPASIGSLEDDLDWSRAPLEEERSHTWVHAYDRNGSYLAGVSGTYFGRGSATHYRDGIDFQGQTKQAYYRVQLPDSTPWNAPSPFGSHNDARLGKDAWITTHTYAIATSVYGFELPVLEAYVWEHSHKALDGWAKVLSSAAVELKTSNPDDIGAREIVKAIYTHTIGQMGGTREGASKMPGFAPERRHQLQARARANMLYRIHQIGQETGRWPLAVLKDTILYSSNEDDPQIAWPGKPEHFSTRLGSYKHEGSALMSEQVAYFTGKGYRGKFGLER